MFDAVDQGEDRAPLRMSRTSEPHQFPPDAIFLSGELQGDVRNGIEVGFRAGERVEAPRVDDQVCVTEAKWAGVWVGCVGVFTGPKEKEEPQEEHVGNRCGIWRVGTVPLGDGM